MNKYVLWVDISKQSLDIYDDYNNKSYKIQNNFKEITNFLKKLDKESKNKELIDGNLCIAYEPTWAYGQNLIKAINGLSIESFAIWLDTITQLVYALWDRNKNDKIDAKKIALVWRMLIGMWDGEFSNSNSSLKVRTIKTPSNEVLLLKNYTTHIRCLKDEIRKSKQYIHVAEKQWFIELNGITKHYKKSIKDNEKMIKEIYVKMKKIIGELDYLEKLEKLKSIPWVWDESAILLTVFFIELIWKWLTKSDSAKVKASTWLDPRTKSSWEYLNTSTISKRWDSHIRSWLFFGWMIWYRFLDNLKYENTTIWRFGKRMKDKFIGAWNNRRVKSVICAIESKIITTAWAMFWDNTEYNYS